MAVRPSVAAGSAARRVPKGLILLPGIIGLFYYGWTRRHEFVHDGRDERKLAAEANSLKFQEKMNSHLSNDAK